MATNDLYKLIQEKQADIDTQTATLASKQKSAPQVEAGLRETVLGGDTLLDQLRNQYSSGVLNLFKYDQEKSKSYLSPELEAKGMVADPMVGQANINAKFNATAATNEEVWKQLDKRKTVLGDTIKSAMDLYNAELEGDKTAISAAESALDAAIKAHAEQRLSETSGIDTSAEGKQTAKYKNMAINDIKEGKTLEDVMDTYANTLELPDILDAYDNNTIYGPRTQDNSKAMEMYNKSKKSKSITDPFADLTPNQAMAKKVEAQPYATMVGQLEGLKAEIANDEYKGTPGKQLLNPILGMGLGNPQDVKMHNILSNINNRIIYLRSGKQINESEYKRLESTMANIGNMKGSNIDRINLLLSEFYDTLGAYGINKSNLEYVFPNAAANVEEAAGTSGSGSNKVHVQLADGRDGFVDKSELEDVLKNGGKQL